MPAHKKEVAKIYPASAEETSSLYLGSGGGSFGDDSTTIGYLPTASGEKAIAMGITTNASGYGSIALGNYSVAAGPLPGTPLPPWVPPPVSGNNFQIPSYHIS